MKTRWMAGLTAGLALVVAVDAGAQSLGSFTWQQQPYCNLITVNVVQQGSVYQLDGYDDQCGATTRASVTGMAFPNPNGTIGIGLTIVTSATAAPVHLSASLSLPSVSGTWKDSTGQSGTYAFYAGGAVSGSARPAPVTAFPSGISLSNTTITNVAAPVNASDAATKGYVDGGIATTRTYALGLASRSINIGAYGATADGASTLAYGCRQLPAAGGVAYLDLPVPAGARIGAVRAKYADSSSSDITFALNRVEFNGTSMSLAAASSSTSTGTGEAVVSVPIFSSAANNTTSTTQSFYLSALAPSHTGALSFCGVSVDFVLQ